MIAAHGGVASCKKRGTKKELESNNIYIITIVLHTGHCVGAGGGADTPSDGNGVAAAESGRWLTVVDTDAAALLESSSSSEESERRMQSDSSLMVCVDFTCKWVECGLHFQA